MKFVSKSLFTSTLIGLIAAASAFADEAGKAEYETYCVSCHGASGAGDGPFAEVLSVAVPDLTTLSEANDGEFPMLGVIKTIDGRNAVFAHGGVMPFWGRRFMREAPDATTGFDAELMVRGRVLALAQYLETIQK